MQYPGYQRVGSVWKCFTAKLQQRTSGIFQAPYNGLNHVKLDNAAGCHVSQLHENK